MLASLIYLCIQPTNDANWSPDQRKLPEVTISEGRVDIKNIRDFTYRSVSDYTPSYYDNSFNTESITSVDYIVEPFGDFSGSAHTFLSFGFADGKRVAISIEIRKEIGETFSPLKSLFKQYEIMYVIADERDVIKLRTNFRKDNVYLYPLSIDQQHAKQLFISMVTRAEKLRTKPEFYNLITNTCTTNIVHHVNEIAPKEIPFSFKVLMPGYSDKLAYDLGLINTTLPYESIRSTFRVNEKAERFADDPDFSNKIRE
jgi:hypothetical protein